MWIMTTIGFFSAVQKPQDDQLTIRARVRADLEALAQHLPELGPIQEGGGTDYPYRARVPHAAFALAVAKLSHDIDYPNFKNAVATQQGQARAKAYGKVWSALYGLQEPSDQKHRPPLPAVASHGPAPAGGRPRYGGVVVNARGQLLLREPTDHYDNYVWTYPKGAAQRGESPEDAALRETREEGGFVCEIVGLVPGWFEGGTSHTAFFLMRPLEEVGFDQSETSAVRWVSLEDADGLIRQTRNPIGRKRDLAVLEAVRKLLHPSARGQH